MTKPLPKKGDKYRVLRCDYDYDKNEYTYRVDKLTITNSEQVLFRDGDGNIREGDIKYTATYDHDGSSHYYTATQIERFQNVDEEIDFHIRDKAERMEYLREDLKTLQEEIEAEEAALKALEALKTQ